MKNIILEAAPNSTHYKTPGTPLPTAKPTPTHFFYQLVILAGLVLYAIVFPAL